MKQVVSLSGGKDSTAMLLMMIERGEQIDDIVFFDWGMEFPQMYEHLDKLEDYIKRPITRLYPTGGFEYYLVDRVKVRGKRKGERGYGWANFHCRWCTRVKYNAINKHTNGAGICIGYAYEERFRRPRYFPHQRYPLLEWGVAETVARDYCYSLGFDWGGLYKIFDRVSCWCCPMKNRRELLAIHDNFPELWQELLRLDAKSPYPHPQEKLLRVLTPKE